MRKYAWRRGYSTRQVNLIVETLQYLLLLLRWYFLDCGSSATTLLQSFSFKFSDSWHWQGQQLTCSFRSSEWDWIKTISTLPFFVDTLRYNSNKSQEFHQSNFHLDWNRAAIFSHSNFNSILINCCNWLKGFKFSKQDII